MLFTFTKFWSKFIRTQASVKRQWVSWTILLMISLNGLRLRLPGWLIIISDLQSRVAKYKLQCDCCCQVSWLSMRSAKARRQWLNTRAPSEPISVKKKSPFQGPQITLRSGLFVGCCDGSRVVMLSSVCTFSRTLQFGFYNGRLNNSNFLSLGGWFHLKRFCTSGMDNAPHFVGRVAQLVRAGRVRDRIPVWTRFATHPVKWVPGVECGRGVLPTTYPLLVPRSW